MSAFTQNDLSNSLNQTNPTSVICQFNNKGNLAYVDMTVSTPWHLRVQPDSGALPASHSYIQAKFNAILFNPSNNPRLQLLIIDDQQANLYANTIIPASNAASLVCFLASGSSSPVLSLTSISSSILTLR